jgi:prephenate dehydratase
MIKKTIAFQGLEGANSYLACNKFYPDFKTRAFATFCDVFRAVEAGEVNYGMIPLENSLAGRVYEIHHLLYRYQVKIIAEHFVAIEHHLAAVNNATLSDIKKVYSHPQALMQCQNNINRLPNFQKQTAPDIANDPETGIYEVSNTAQAAKLVLAAADKTKAAICSKVAAKLNGLKILQKNMQDAKSNSTIFIVIAGRAAKTDPALRPVIISLMFTIKNYPGSLYKALGSFATNNVSLIQIESFIRSGIQAPGGVSQEAAFFAMIDGHIGQKNIALALKELEFFAQGVKILGVYYADKARLLQSFPK